MFNCTTAGHESRHGLSKPPLRDRVSGRKINCTIRPLQQSDGILMALISPVRSVLLAVKGIILLPLFIFFWHFYFLLFIFLLFHLLFRQKTKNIHIWKYNNYKISFLELKAAVDLAFFGQRISSN